MTRHHGLNRPRVVGAATSRLSVVLSVCPMCGGPAARTTRFPKVLHRCANPACHHRWESLTKDAVRETEAREGEGT